MPICTRITSQSAFDDMKAMQVNRLLMFIGDNTNPHRLDQYEEAAFDGALEAGISLESFCINIDRVELSQDDIDTFQDGNRVICVTTVDSDGRVSDKRLAPSPIDVRDMILNLS